jgi:hypothetical protein
VGVKKVANVFLFVGTWTEIGLFGFSDNFSFLRNTLREREPWESWYMEKSFCRRPEVKGNKWLLSSLFCSMPGILTHSSMQFCSICLFYYIFYFMFLSFFFGSFPCLCIPFTARYAQLQSPINSKLVSPW